MADTTIFNPAVPYNADIPSGIFSGRIITIHGLVPSNSTQFRIDLQSKYPSLADPEIILHFNVRFNENAVVLNSTLSGRWLVEQRERIRFQKGKPFEMIIMTENTHYKIAINGAHCCEFKHRCPFKDVQRLSINGAVVIHQIAYHSSFVMQKPTAPWPARNTSMTHPASFAVCPPGPPQYKLQPIYNPAIPFNFHFKTGLDTGITICISGRPIPSAKMFAINLVSGIDIAMHLNPRFNENKVVKNSKINNVWGMEENNSLTFAQGVNFDLSISVLTHALEMVLNGQFFAQYPHRLLPIKRISNLVIEGDILITSVRFF